MRVRPSSLAIAAIAVALLLIAYNNVMYSTNAWAFPSPWLLYPRAVLLPALAVLAALRLWRLSPLELGLSSANAAKSIAVGLGIAAVAAGPVVLYLAFPIGLAEGALRFHNIDGASGNVGGALYWAFLLYPLHTVIFEEVLFRGVLQGLAVRAFRLRPGIALTAAAFALWHVTTDVTVLGKAGIAEDALLFVLAQLLVLAGLFAGGLVLGVMRQRAGNLLTQIAFHWGFLASLGGALFLLAR